jgi:group I intron endonuclease
VGAGVYRIRNVVSGRAYVGSAVNVDRRWAMHRHLLNSGKHHSLLLQRSWQKHGASAFAFEFLEEVASAGDLIAREQHWIDECHSADPKTGFNISPIAGSRLGTKHGPEAIAKMRAKSSKGKKRPPFAPEHRAAISASRMGHPCGKGVPKSAEHKQAQRIAMSGRTMPWVAESNRARKGKRQPASSADGQQKRSSKDRPPPAIQVRVVGKSTGGHYAARDSVLGHLGHLCPGLGWCHFRWIWWAGDRSCDWWRHHRPYPDWSLRLASIRASGVVIE